MAVRVTSLDARTAFSEMCETFVVNAHGAGVRAPAAMPVATRIQLETADHRTALGWVTDFEPIGTDSKWWLLGIGLEQPSNFWKVPNPPDNWSGRLAPVEAPKQSPERKFNAWPGAYGPESEAAASSPPAVIDNKAGATVRPVPTPSVVPPVAARECSDPALLSRIQAALEQRTEEHWRRLRSELEPQLLESTRSLQKELQEGLAAWRTEKAAIEGKLGELMAVRDEVATRLGSVAGLLREEAAPMREEIAAEARRQVNLLIGEFQEHLRGQRQAMEMTGERQTVAVTKVVEEQIQTKTDAVVQQLLERNAEEVAGLASAAMDRLERQLQSNLGQAAEKLQRDMIADLQQRQAATQALAAQVGQRHEKELAGAHDAFHGEVERLERRAAELDSGLTEVRQAREYVESLSKVLPETIRLRVQESVAALVEQMHGLVQEQFTQGVQSEIAGLQRRVQEIAGQVGASVTGAAEAAQREQQLQSSFSACLSRLQAQAAAVRDEAGRIGKDFEQQRQRLLESAAASLQALAERDISLQQNFKAFTVELDGKKNEMAAAAQSGLDQARVAETRLRETADALNAGLIARTQESLELMQASVCTLVAEREQGLQQLLSESRKHVESELQQKAAAAAVDLQRQLQQEFERRQQSIEKSRAAAMEQLESLEQRAEHLTSLVDVELQKRSDGFVDETVREATMRLKAASEQVREVHLERTQADMEFLLDGKLKPEAEELLRKSVAAAAEQLAGNAEAARRDQLARAQSELHRILGTMARQAADAGSGLRQQADQLRRELEQAREQSGAIRSQVEEAQQWLSRETELFQKTLHETFLSASSELKGRIHQAVEMAEEPIERHKQEIQAQLASVAQEKTGELRGVFEEARDRLRNFAETSELDIETELQQQLSQALQTFREDAGKLASHSLERWQTAIKETLSELPRLLSEKLGSEQGRG